MSENNEMMIFANLIRELSLKVVIMLILLNLLSYPYNQVPNVFMAMKQKFVLKLVIIWY